MKLRVGAVIVVVRHGSTMMTWKLAMVTVKTALLVGPLVAMVIVFVKVMVYVPAVALALASTVIIAFATLSVPSAVEMALISELPLSFTTFQLQLFATL